MIGHSNSRYQRKVCRHRNTREKEDVCSSHPNHLYPNLNRFVVKRAKNLPLIHCSHFIEETAIISFIIPFLIRHISFLVILLWILVDLW